MMVTHHQTAITMASQARRDGDPFIARIATRMLADQTIEAAALRRFVLKNLPLYRCDIGSNATT